MKTLVIEAQSSKLSFTKLSVKLATSDSIAKIKLFKGSYASEVQLQDKRSILGSIIYHKDSLVFKPLIPFQTNTIYTVVFKENFYEFSIPLNPNYKHLTIEEIYPNAITLPANFLKWYVAFSKPVNHTNIYDHIILINNITNTKVDRAVLPLETPLLSDDGKLLTIWIEPGRQKRDLGPNKRLGEVLKRGVSYTLIIDKNLKDVDGIPMDVDFKHTFMVEAADRVKPSIKKWEFSPVKPNTKQPLIIKLNDILDYGSLYNSVLITHKNGKVIHGNFTIETNKNRIVFRPNNIWVKGGYVVKCSKVVEDISGNNLERLFDRVIQKDITLPILERTFSIIN